MVHIILANQNPLSQYREVNINLATGRCTFAEHQEIELQRLTQEWNFSHPLLIEPYSQTSKNIFHYEYDDIEGLLYSGIYVYQSLLQAKEPLSCQFKINPSPQFKNSSFAKQIYFSINWQRKATEVITIKKMEELVSDLSGFPFHFSEQLIIDDEFTFEDLPQQINGESLYRSNIDMVKLLKKPSNLKKYELRYINPELGFGVFSREAIKKGEPINIYTGVKRTPKFSHFKYAFVNQRDCLNMYLDARQLGNITRFINHAPRLDTHSHIDASGDLLYANISATRQYLNGIEVVLYSAAKDIDEGEQILVDYGKEYFEHLPMVRFKKNGKLFKLNKKYLVGYSQKKIGHLRHMANHGVKSAQSYLLLRIVSIAIVTIILIGVLKYFF